MAQPKFTKPIVAGNWKMHPGSLHEAKKLFAGVKRTAPHLEHPTTIICPPDLYLGVLAEEYGGTKLFFGSQDVSTFTRVGAHTGEVSAEQIKNAGADVSIIGHSERRAMGETDKMVVQKVKRALAADLAVILCVGESERDNDGQYLSFLRQQITSVFSQIEERFYDQIIIAYEPLWAIGGSSDTAITPHVLHQTIGFIRKVLRRQVARGLGEETSIIYGGSVKRNNARELFSGTDVDGFLPGSASLDAEHFCDILRAVNETYNDDI